MNGTDTVLQKSTKRYFLAVDGFRLIASVNIVLFHLQGIGGFWELREQPEWLFKILKGPAFHASVFFMLGGFIFTVKFAEKAAHFNTWSFVKSRFRELFPLHCLTTVLMTLLKTIIDVSHGTLSIPLIVKSLFMHLTLLWSLFPFGTDPLNCPSWALSAFFLCYLLFGPILKFVMNMTSKIKIGGTLGFCMVPIIIWTLLFGAFGHPLSLYHFFHTFAPIRFFEFMMGMLLARWFLLTRMPQQTSFVRGIINDCCIIGSIVIIYLCLQFPNEYNRFQIYFHYHVTMIPLYLFILYCLAREEGIIAKLLSISFIRKTGRCSFYPYLIHIPLISIITYILEKYFSYYEFLHRPVNMIVFTLLIYGGAYWYVNHLRKRKPSGPQSAA